jgi:acetylornithine deacetylase/succinyl-diaminopimelate desuccinylase-like protein
MGVDEVVGCTLGTDSGQAMADTPSVDTFCNMQIVEEEWNAAMPNLQDFVRIPNLSVAYDPAWATNGLLEKVCDHVQTWVEAQGVKGLTVETLKDPGLSPFMIIEIPGTEGSTKAATTFVMYGHLDKQPHGPGWDADISPVGGLIKDGKLFGRGAADDGYAVYACVIAVKALQRQGIDHPRVVIIAECSEESGSPHLGHYMEKLADRIGTPSAVFCMDSLAEDYSTLWMTTSLRGVVSGSLEVSVLKDGLHSGFGGGIVPDPFRVARMLLERAEDTKTGEVLIPEMHTKVPVERQEAMKDLSDEIPRPDLQRKFAWQDGARPMNENEPLTMYRNNTWKPCMTVVGFEGLPVPERAGNVLNIKVKLQLSFRIPPLVDHNVAAQAVEKLFETDPPYGAKVTAKFVGHSANGWNCSELKPNIQLALNEAAKAYFNGKGFKSSGVGATIPLMNMLQDMFPDTSLIVTGTLGPGTNMHGPNEHLPIGYTKKVTAAIAMMMGNLKEDKASDSCEPPVKKRKAQYCFIRPDIPIGQCLCCL